MPTIYKSIPVYMSGFNQITGYRCPVDKTAVIKQISLSNETTGFGVIDIKWADYNSVGIGTTMQANVSLYPLVVSGIVSGFSTRKALEEFISIQRDDAIVLRTPTTGRINVIFTVLEQDRVD